ncbi:M48 family metalloprotease [Pseudomonas sp. CrR25]|nr:M48 family metalloprotease [Pseudomonas sp. CrR25]
MSRRILLLCALLALLAGCASTAQIRPLTDAPEQFGSFEDEQVLFKRSQQMHDELQKRGLLLRDAQLDAYLQELGRRLKPANLGERVDFRFYVLRDPVVNAFALPDGRLYFNVGLLARLEDEAMLVQVMAHEMSHVLQRHSLIGSRTRQNTIVAAHIGNLLLGGSNLIYLPAFAGLAGHSRDQERDADQRGWDLMRTAGYPLQHSDQLFSLLGMVKYQEGQGLYASHPDNRERAENARQMAAAHPDAGQGLSESQARYRPYRLRLLREDIRLKQRHKLYALALESQDRAEALEPKAAELRLLRADTLRLLANDAPGAAREHAFLYGTTRKKEESAFREEAEAHRQEAAKRYQALLDEPRQGRKALRGLGLLRRDQQRPREAREHLQAYLAGPAKGGDRLYLQAILKQLDQE